MHTLLVVCVFAVEDRERNVCDVVTGFLAATPQRFLIGMLRNKVQPPRFYKWNILLIHTLESTSQVWTLPR